MKTLNTIQTLFKVGKVLSRIIFILCLLGAILCAVGIIGLAIIPEGLTIGETTVHGLLENSAEMTPGSCCIAAAWGLIICVGEAVLSKLAEQCFARELEAGTPFTLKGAGELIRLGVCAICIPLGTRVAADIVCEILRRCFRDAEKLQSWDTVSVGVGVMLIFMGLICRYGAELTQGQGTAAGE